MIEGLEAGLGGAEAEAELVQVAQGAEAGMDRGVADPVGELGSGEVPGLGEGVEIAAGREEGVEEFGLALGEG